MTIDPVAAIPAEITSQLIAERVATPRADFGSLVGPQLEGLNQVLLQSEAATVDFALGGGASIHEVMMSIEQARLSLQLAVEVRNKAVEAYQELMRMQL